MIARWGTTAGRTSVRPAVSRDQRRRLELALFILPALLFYLAFVFYPVVQAIHYSLYNWSGLGPISDFAGIGNYKAAFHDPAFTGAIKHNFILVVLSLVFQFPIALGVALLVNRPFRGRSIARLVFFAPYVLSEAITAVIWLLILQPDGLVDRSFEAVGLGGAVHLWLADLHIVLFTMFVVITWKYVGFGIILFLAGLQGIPDEIQEAAAIDGAGSWAMTRRTSRSRCSGRRSASGRSSRSSARCSCSTSSGSSPPAGRPRHRTRWRSTCSTTASRASRSATAARSR